MELPPSEELSRWTVGHVSSWLSQCSLSVFRDDFLYDGIDGSRLLRLTASEVNQKYKHISSKKRNILLDYLNRIQSSRQLPAWNTAPNLPPRPGPAPTERYNDSDESDQGWSDDDFDDYLEPSARPLEGEEDPGFNTNGNMLDGPEASYEIPEDELDEIRQQPHRGLDCKPTIVDRLRDELLIHKGNNRREPPAAAAPPPRPPRSSRTPGGGSRADRPPISPPHHRSPQPLPPVQNMLPPENAYEAMNDVITETKADDDVYVRPDPSDSPQNSYLDLSETCKRTQKMTQQYPPPPPSVDVNVPPRPARRGVAERPPESPPPPSRDQRSRYAYQEVKKPGGRVQEDPLSRYDWYHGKIGRDHAEEIFQREQMDGMFLVRKSERDPRHPYTLVLWHCNRIWNIPIRLKDSGYFAAGKAKEGESEFASVEEIVEHFKVVSLNLKSDNAMQGAHTLTYPAPKY